MKKYSGGCQCGKVRYEVAATIDTVMECNCSMCSKKGILMTFVPVEQFKLLKGQDDLTDHLFNKHVIHHYFCSSCGIHSFAEGKRPDGLKMYCINVRCLDDVDPALFTIKKIDGRSF